MSLELVIVLMNVTHHHRLAFNGTKIMSVSGAVLELTSCSHGSSLAIAVVIQKFPKKLSLLLLGQRNTFGKWSVVTRMLDNGIDTFGLGISIVSSRRSHDETYTECDSNEETGKK